MAASTRKNDMRIVKIGQSSIASALHCWFFHCPFESAGDDFTVEDPVFILAVHIVVVCIKVKSNLSYDRDIFFRILTCNNPSLLSQVNTDFIVFYLVSERQKVDNVRKYDPRLRSADRGLIGKLVCELELDYL